MKKMVVIIIAVIVLLGIAVACGKKEPEIALDESAQFSILSAGEVVKTYTLADIRTLGEVEFAAIKDTSKTDSAEYKYTGVPLINLFEYAGVEVLSDSVITNTASDGYGVAIEGEKVLDAENVYIVYMRDGKVIGSEEQGGSGPLMIVISKDQFSNKWCKFAVSSGIE